MRKRRTVGREQRNATTAERRRRIYEILGLPESFTELCESKFPHFDLDLPLVIAQEHEPWYDEERRRGRTLYWDAYRGQLMREGWAETSLLQLEISTTSVIERLTDPSRREAYQSKGLVVGYVQSGKTANFLGVIAKAADAGYKLIIVLAGMQDVLRNQTQRRLDRDLIGKELIGDDYGQDNDFESFISHGQLPSSIGYFDFYRLTGPEGDYRRLKRGLDALKFTKSDATKPFYDPVNLATASTRIAVVKKNGTVLQHLLKDLELIRNHGGAVPVQEIPALVIDDESDQASINTAKPSKDHVTRRSTTNDRVVSLLAALPRVQYVGYTATPFANVFIDPDCEEDIFPKDFLVSLPKPENYMGVAEFYDLDGVEGDLSTRPNERDFMRAVKGSDSAAENLQKAIDTFVLTGAVKAYRQALGIGSFRHHTMLIHSSVNQKDHATLADLVRDIFAKAGYDGGAGAARLKKLYEEDISVVSLRRNGRLPERFELLAGSIGLCLANIGPPREAVLVVNDANRDQTPDFDKKESVWKILVGGAKLSRGYTVEGLTVSYYRRRAATADTLMQMGRWFGFRRNYDDLVRLFIGTEEPIDRAGKKKINLYTAFGQICRDEEFFRSELRRYANIDDRITPRQIPPLVPSHMLMPTARNKMYNSKIVHRNFGGQLSESTFASPKPADALADVDALDKAIGKGAFSEREFDVRQDGRRISSFSALVCTAAPAAVLVFLKSYHWFETARPSRANPLQLQIEYLEGTGDLNPDIDKWLVVSPKLSEGAQLFPFHKALFTIVRRGRRDDGRFTTYNTPVHREVAKILAGQIPDAEIERLQISEDLKDLRQPRQAVALLYFVTDAEGDGSVVTVGFTLFFPRNRIKGQLTFGVVRPDKMDAIIVETAT